MAQHSQSQTFRPRSMLDFAKVREQLRSEYGPAFYPTPDIFRELADASKDIEDYEAEIHRLQTRITHLQNKQTRLRDYQLYLQALCSPMRRLPTEVLAHIFDLTCDMNELMSRKVERMPALALGGVCWRWRHLAKSCIGIWSRIQVLLADAAPRRVDIPILALYLDYSGRSLLSIEITGESQSMHSRNLAILASLNRLSHRWQRLRITSFPSWSLVSRIFPNHFPALEEFDCGQIRDDRGPWIRFKNAPKLRKLIVGATSPQDLLKPMSLWKQLSCLFIHGHPIGMDRTMKLCSNLTDLTLRERYAESASIVPCEPARRNYVEKLSLLVGQTSQEFKSLADVAFASMTCPDLVSLSIDALTQTTWGRYRRFWPKASLHAFLSRSSCCLTTLSIKGIPLSDLNLLDLLRQLPSLLHLTIDDSNVDDDKSPLTSEFVRGLRVSGLAVLLPKLEALSLTLSQPAEFCDQELVDMVSSRWLPDNRVTASETDVACLRSVVIRFSRRSVKADIYSPLYHLEKAGMMVVVAGPTQ